MFQENYGFFLPRPQKKFTSNRRFGTDLTTTGQIRRVSIVKPLKEDPLDESFRIFHNIESDFLPDWNYMHLQDDISESMRGILIDWLVLIQNKFHFAPETLFLTVNILDRYLGKRLVHRKRLQLVGICAMFIAGKYEESAVPELKDLVYISANTYTKTEIIDMELDILAEIGFNVTVISPLKFLERYTEKAHFDQNQFFLTRYFTELTLIEYSFIRYKPSIIAASAVYLVGRFSKSENCLESTPYHYTDIRECAISLLRIIEKSSIHSLQAIQTKFQSSTHREVAKSVITFPV